MASTQPSLQDLHSYTMLIISIVFLTLSAMSLVLRLYVRAAMIGSVGWADWLMLVTWIFYAGLCGLLIGISLLEITAGLSDSTVVAEILTVWSPLASIIYFVSLTNYKFVVCIFGVYIVTTVLFKVSLAVFFLRLVSQKWQRHLIIASATLYTLFGTAWLFVALFQCGNPALFYENEVAGKCLPFKKVLRPLNYTHGALNAITDWIFVVIPMFVVRSSQIPRKAKITVCAILGLGVLGSICSLVRLAYVDVLGVALDDLLVKAPDYAIVSIVELGLGITSANLATLRPLFSSCLYKARTGIGSSRSRGTKTTTGRKSSRFSKKHGITASGAYTDDSMKGAVMVTKELHVSASRPVLGEDLELYELPTSHEDTTRGITTTVRTNRSQSSEISLLQV